MKYTKAINGNLSQIKINNYLIIISIKFTSLIILYCVVQVQTALIGLSLELAYRLTVPLYIYLALSPLLLIVVVLSLVVVL